MTTREWIAYICLAATSVAVLVLLGVLYVTSDRS